MEDIINSRARARLSQGWKTGQLLRIGDPFHSREEAMSPWTAEGTDAGLLLEYIANYNEKYPTPKEIQTEDFNEVLKFSENVTDRDYQRNNFVYNFLSSLRQKINDPLGKKKIN